MTTTAHGLESPHDAPEQEIVDSNLEIVDAHHHLWDTREPKYLVSDLLQDCASGHRVTSTVFVECGWGWDDRGESQFAPVGEVRRVVDASAECRRSGSTYIAAIVGHADLRYGARVGSVLDALADAGQGLFVGIRHASAWDAASEIPVHPTRPGPGLLTRSDFRSGFLQLAKRDLTFDAWLFHPQIPELTRLARSFPDTRIILNHLGAPLAIGPYANRQQEVKLAWEHSMSELRLMPNVYLKLGGIAMSTLVGEVGDGPSFLTSDTLVGRWGPRIRWCIEQFGADRCMFESNFPVDKVRTSYVAVWNAFKCMVADASESEKAALFRDTATAVYGLRS